MDVQAITHVTDPGARFRLMCDTGDSIDARHSRNASGVERGRAEIRLPLAGLRAC